MPELPPLADVLDPPCAGSGPVVRMLAILLAATFTRKLAAESPDIAIERMSMDFIYSTNDTRTLTPSVQSDAYCFHPRNQRSEHGQTSRALPGRHAKGLLEALGIARPDLGIDDARRAFAVERLQHLLGGDAAHVLARLDGDAGCVRACQHI